MKVVPAARFLPPRGKALHHVLLERLEDGLLLEREADQRDEIGEATTAVASITRMTDG